MLGNLKTPTWIDLVRVFPHCDSCLVSRCLSNRLAWWGDNVRFCGGAGPSEALTSEFRRILGEGRATGRSVLSDICRHNGVVWGASSLQPRKLAAARFLDFLRSRLDNWVVHRVCCVSAFRIRECSDSSQGDRHDKRNAKHRSTSTPGRISKDAQASVKNSYSYGAPPYFRVDLHGRRRILLDQDLAHPSKIHFQNLFRGWPTRPVKSVSTFRDSNENRGQFSRAREHRPVAYRQRMVGPVWMSLQELLLLFGGGPVVFDT
jgi:hypothetical protein